MSTNEIEKFARTLTNRLNERSRQSEERAKSFAKGCDYEKALRNDIESNVYLSAVFMVGNVLRDYAPAVPPSASESEVPS